MVFEIKTFRKAFRTKYDEFTDVFDELKMLKPINDSIDLDSMDFVLFEALIMKLKTIVADIRKTFDRTKRALLRQNIDIKSIFLPKLELYETKFMILTKLSENLHSFHLIPTDVLVTYSLILETERF